MLLNQFSLGWALCRTFQMAEFLFQNMSCKSGFKLIWIILAEILYFTQLLLLRKIFQALWKIAPKVQQDVQKKFAFIRSNWRQNVPIYKTLWYCIPLSITEDFLNGFFMLLKIQWLVKFMENYRQNSSKSFLVWMFWFEFH